ALAGEEDGPVDPRPRRRHVQPARRGALVGGGDSADRPRRPRRRPGRGPARSLLRHRRARRGGPSGRHRGARARWRETRPRPRALGADAAIDVERDEVVASVKDATGGGAEVVVDTTPYAPQSLNHAVAIAVRRGRIVVAGLKGQRRAQDLPVDSIIYKELTIRGVLSMPVDDTFRACELIESGRYPFARLHTHSFPIEQV